MELKRPCKHCPFRTDMPTYLTPVRAKQIVRGITEEDKAFICHDTRNMKDRKQHCAGAMIMLQKEGRPNQAMRMAERLELFSPKQLNLKAPVYASTKHFLAAYAKMSTKTKNIIQKFWKENAS